MQRGTPEVDERVERRADRAPREQDVVDEQDASLVYGEGDLGSSQQRLRSDRVPHEIVPIQRDVEGAGRHLAARDLQQAAGQPLRERHAAAPNADQRDIAGAPIALHDLMRDPHEGAANSVRLHHQWHEVLPGMPGLAAPPARNVRRRRI